MKPYAGSVDALAKKQSVYRERISHSQWRHEQGSRKKRKISVSGNKSNNRWELPNVKKGVTPENVSEWESRVYVTLYWENGVCVTLYWENVEMFRVRVEKEGTGGEVTCRKSREWSIVGRKAWERIFEILADKYLVGKGPERASTEQSRCEIEVWEVGDENVEDVRLEKTNNSVSKGSQISEIGHLEFLVQKTLPLSSFRDSKYFPRK